MAKRNLTTEVLMQIRDELRVTGGKIDKTNEELQRTRQELVERIDRLERRQLESEVHLATELVSVAGAIKELSKLVAEDRQLRGQVADHEKRLSSLERAG